MQDIQKLLSTTFYVDLFIYNYWLPPYHRYILYGSYEYTQLHMFLICFVQIAINPSVYALFIQHRYIN